ncbi:MAG: prepilin-type N-terminal cleavage/methylation domain-containing protein [Phycisphaerae bacterium]|nr:prepilin-type N-terminal cleavage/methylation domain-containing protein [Phycisphaerae bacterium]
MSHAGTTRTPFVRPRARCGFTLVELLVACVLLVLIMLATSYVFDTTTTVISETQAGNDANLGAAGMAELFRKDIRGAETGGWLIFGRRDVGKTGTPVYGNRRQQEIGQSGIFRTDWMELMTATEQASAVDSRLISQWTRVLYGHGRYTNPAAVDGNGQSTFAPITTDWVLLRHQLLILVQLPFSWDKIETVQPAMSGMNEVYTVALYGAGVDIGGDSAGGMWRVVRGVRSYGNRDWRWYWYDAYAWRGSISTPAYGSTAVAIYEPSYWQDFCYRTYGTYNDRTRFQAMAYCAEFKLQYAMPEDLRAADGGGVQWRDPPATTDKNYADFNYRPGDPAHPNQILPANDSRNAGRLVFGPGDRWPAMLKATVRTYDPRDRLDDCKAFDVVVQIPR